jgi:two-component system sensor histidine kinase KdpD
MASRLKGDLDVLYVAASDATRPGDRQAVEKLRQLAADVGARWYEVQDDDPTGAMVSFAQEHQITQIVVGSSQRSRWQQLTGGGSKVTRIIREAGVLGIDVHVIALRKASAAPVPSGRPPR